MPLRDPQESSARGVRGILSGSVPSRTLIPYPLLHLEPISLLGNQLLLGPTSTLNYARHSRQPCGT